MLRFSACSGCFSASSALCISVIVGSAIALAGALAFATVESPEPALIPLQPLLNELEVGATLVLPPGRYAGPVIIDKRITLDGQDKAIIDGGGKGTVVSLETDGATIHNLHITNSGGSNNDLDAGIRVRGNFNVIRDNLIDNALFGVDIQESSNNIIRRNRIHSKTDRDLGLRGDAIWLWYSNDNKIVDNEIRDSRDSVAWYSKDNLFSGNDQRGGRYALHFMFSKSNKVVDNHYEDNAIGIFLMYSDGVEIRRNFIANATGPTGVGLGMKESSNLVVTDNVLVRNAKGFLLDVSPYEPDTTNRIERNRIAYNGIGVEFLSDWHGNQITDNTLEGNLVPVLVNGGGGATRNDWRRNHWDDYQGFDRNGDGVGDTPHELYAYADRIWMDVPNARFFIGTPVLATLDFLERLAPFSEPTLLVKDPEPRLDSAIQVASAADGTEGEAPKNAQPGSGIISPDNPFGL